MSVIRGYGLQLGPANRQLILGHTDFYGPIRRQQKPQLSKLANDRDK
jgi:hypothetical protein